MSNVRRTKQNTTTIHPDMKTRITVHREDNYFIAIDFRTHVADQGTTREEAIRNLMCGLKEHHTLLEEFRLQK